jgi:hypothetical protein
MKLKARGITFFLKGCSFTFWFRIILAARGHCTFESHFKEGCGLEVPVRVRGAPLGIDPATFGFVAQCLNHCATARHHCLQIGPFKVCCFKVSWIIFFTSYNGQVLWIFSRPRFKIIRIFLRTSERGGGGGERETETEAQYIIACSLEVIWILLNAHFAFSISRQLVQKFYKCFTFDSPSLFPSSYVTYFSINLLAPEFFNFF